MVALQPLNDQSTLLQITQIRFGSIQSELEQRHPLPFEQFDLVQLEAEHEKLLALPLRFLYKQGMVSDIIFSPDDEPWSANIKRAVLNMLQVNLQKGQTDLAKNKISDIQSDPLVAVERTLEGECEVTYSKTELFDDQIQWTKSINYQKCVSRPEVLYGRRFTERCEECEKTTSEEILSNSVLTFNHLFAPLSEKQQLVASFGCNKLVLVYAGETETRIKETRGVKESLIYNPDFELAEERFAMTGEEKYLRRIPQWNNKVEHVQKLIATLAKHVDGQIELETSHIVARLVKILRIASEEEVKRIHHFLYDSKRYDERTMEKVQSIYNDALAMAGTKVTVSHLVDKISKKLVQPVKAARLLKSLVEIRTPSQEIVDEIARLCDSDVAARNPIVKQSCFLTYGSVLNGLCGESTERTAMQYDSKKACTRQVKEQFVRKLIEQYERSESRYEKVLSIKTLANAAIDTSIYELEKIITDRKTEKMLRVQALDALRKLRSVMPRKIQNILMPLYKDHTDSPEVRMAALYQIMHTAPEKMLIDQIVHNIQKDRSRQVRLFTYSLLKSISESTNPCERKLSLWLTKALRVLPELDRNMLDSRHVSWTMFSSDYETGAAINWAALFSNDSILPKEVMASVDSLLGGQWNKYLIQVGFLQHNLDLVLNSILQKIEESGVEQLVVRGRRSTVFRPTELLRSLYQKLRINRRQSSQDEPHAMLYIRYKDMDYAILPADLETIPNLLTNIVRDGKIQLEDIERLFMPTVGSVQGYLKMEFMPKNSVHFDGLRLRLVVKPFVASTNVVKVEVTSPIFNSGVKLLHSAKLHTPVDVDFEINWQQGLTVKTTVKAPESKKHIAHFQSRPVTFVRVWKKTTRTYPELRFPEAYANQFFPLTANLPKPILIGENMIDVTIEPTHDSPTEYVFQIKADAFQPVERFEKPNFDDFFISNGEYKDEDDNKRRVSFNTYLRNLNVDKAYKHRISLKAKSTGNHMNHEAQVDISSVCDVQVQFCRFQIDARRTPISGENRRWELTAVAQTLYPEVPSTLSNLYDQLQQQFHGLLTTLGDPTIRTHNRDVLVEEQRLTEASKLNVCNAAIDYDVWNLLNIDYQVAKNKEGHAELKLSIEPETRSTFNMTIETATERLILEDLKMPITLPTGNIRSYARGSHDVQTVLDKLIKEQRAECVVKTHEIRTFDNLFFKAPISSCYSVLAKDCSSENPRFAVLIKKLSKSSGQKKLKIISRQNVIEIQLLREQLAKIQLSPLFKNKQCGICGHYDGEEMNDFRGADNVETSSIEKFHRSFVAEDEDCEEEDPELFRKNSYKVIRHNIISGEKDDLLDAQEPILRTEVLQIVNTIFF
uniref:Vitellogenin domain-containing protein n=1 Tax=Heterorhabditis bacteriophora TaxID=37862 RepID=A0A1I7X9X0_HETBA